MCFHRQVWYRTLSLHYACIRRSGIILIPRLTLCQILFRGPHCWASPWTKIAYSITQLIRCPGDRSFCFNHFYCIMCICILCNWISCAACRYGKSEGGESSPQGHNAVQNLYGERHMHTVFTLQSPGVLWRLRPSPPWLSCLSNCNTWNCADVHIVNASFWVAVYCQWMYTFVCHVDAIYCYKCVVPLLACSDESWNWIELDSSHIVVSLFQSMLTLQGTVSCYHQKLSVRSRVVYCLNLYPLFLHSPLQMVVRNRLSQGSVIVVKSSHSQLSELFAFLCSAEIITVQDLRWDELYHVDAYNVIFYIHCEP